MGLYVEAIPLSQPGSAGVPWPLPLPPPGPETPVGLGDGQYWPVTACASPPGPLSAQLSVLYLEGPVDRPPTFQSASCSVPHQGLSSAGTGRGLVSTGLGGLGLKFVLDFLSSYQRDLVALPFPRAGPQLTPLCRGGWTRSQMAGDLDSVWLHVPHLAHTGLVHSFLGISCQCLSQRPSPASACCPPAGTLSFRFLCGIAPPHLNSPAAPGSGPPG